MGMGWRVRGCGELLTPGPQLFKGMEQQGLLALLSEVAAVGQGGLQINETGTFPSPMTLPGTWSDLVLACLIHLGR